MCIRDRIYVVFEHLVDKHAQGLAFFGKHQHGVFKPTKVEQPQIHKAVRDAAVAVGRDLERENILFTFDRMPFYNGVYAVFKVAPNAAPLVHIVAGSVKGIEVLFNAGKVNPPAAEKLWIAVDELLKLSLIHISPDSGDFVSFLRNDGYCPEAQE